MGGTIAMREIGGRLQAGLDGKELLATLPNTDGVGDIDVLALRSVPGVDLTLDDVLDLAEEIDVRLGSQADGVVVTQGTDTLEEVAFALDLIVTSSLPIVVTGALRYPAMPGADGPANLLNAFVVAASPAARDLGVVVVSNDQIHAARFVRKLHTSNPGAFQSPLAGPIGWVSEGTATVVSRPPRLPAIPRPHRASVPLSVALVPLTLGSDGRILRALPAMGFAGAVLELMGAGHAPSAVVDDIEELALAMPVVFASRTGVGQLLHQTYGFVGSEQSMLGAGLISAGWLDGTKARLLLTLLLREGASTAQLRQAFAKYGSAG